MIGTDLLQISRVQVKESLIQLTLRINEIEEFLQLETISQKQRYLASHIAAKEALFKATQNPHYLDYQILHRENGQPYVKDHPEIEISISHEKDYVLCFVLILPSNVGSSSKEPTQS